MIALSFVLVILYSSALLGWLPSPLGDITMATRLDPIIFVVIGYLFGRLPAQQNEKTLKDEIIRQSQKADAAQYAKEQVQQEREALEEKMKNVKAVLAPFSRSPQSKPATGVGGKVAVTPSADDLLRNSITAAVSILDS